VTTVADTRELLLGFINARSWLADVRRHADPHLSCILVGNKVDLVDPDGGTTSTTVHGKRREVSREEGEQWAAEEELLFVEASAKSGQNVELAFEQASRDILSKIRRGVFDDDRVRLIPFFPCASVSNI
jgi:Ras-related protein Rab-2A